MDIEYKTADFYTEYFTNHPDFRLIEPFHLSEDKEEKNLYVGKVEVLKTIHPLELRVEIPITFPHHKLTFRTKSLSGYPHLIHTGKVQYGDWFCLNTPFAETAEEQLKQEVRRLKEWVAQQMKESLPNIISDPNVIRALNNANIAEWMNPDNVKEVSNGAMLTFIGDFAYNINNFTDKKTGQFHCLKTPDARFYVFKEAYDFAQVNLPYIIVDDFPETTEVLDDFIRLKEYYKWDEDTCAHLLPELSDAGKPFYTFHSFDSNLNLSEEEAIKALEPIIQELCKEEPFLFPYTDSILKSFAPTKQKERISPRYKKLIASELTKIESTIKENHGIVVTTPDYWTIPFAEWTEKMQEEYDKECDLIETGQYRYYHFAIGFPSKDGLSWRIFYTNHASFRFEQKSYSINIGGIFIHRPTSLLTDYQLAQTIDHSMFFGRGCLCENFLNKKIALVGLGAIGSMVAETIAHGGVSKIGLWDSDTVEPGNICRSAYTLQDIGESKVQAIKNKIRTINPFILTKEINAQGNWLEYRLNECHYYNGSFYDNINYKSQADAIEQIKDYDLIIDCTGRNELLHFISYAIPNADIVSLCITNQAKELLCVTNKNGNPFELRKAYLSRIEQDTKNFYVEGSGCYEPTFKATHFDICSLVNLCVKELNTNFKSGQLMPTTIFQHSDRGIVTDRLLSFQLKESDIILNIPSEAFLDAQELPDVFDGGYIGHILGCYSKNGKQIMVTHFVSHHNASYILEDAFRSSQGIIDYIGDIAYSQEERETFQDMSLSDIAAKALDETINTNNPLLAVRNPEGDCSFFLYINQHLVPFHKIDT